MTTQTEALKQLIEDLISMMEYHVEQTRPIHTTTVALQTAKETLKALAQQSNEQVKPVTLETVYETIIQWDECGGKRSRRELARRIVSLYTTPPQCKPLTDKQVREIAKQYALSLAFPYGGKTTPEMFARAIEAAHGIKE